MLFTPQGQSVSLILILHCIPLIINNRSQKMFSAYPGSPARIGSFPCKKTPDELGVFPLSAACSSLDSFGHLCPTPFQIYACKKDSHLCKSFSFISSFLSSRAASGQVLSAFVSLTSVFGMDTGDPHSCRHCFSESLFSQNHIEEVLKLFACLGVSKLRPRPISFMSLQALRLFHS